MSFYDVTKDQWATDLAAVLNCSVPVTTDLFNLMKNLACHYIYEQHVNDRNKDTFVVPLPPVGTLTLKHNEDNTWEIVNAVFSPLFTACANETLRCHESNLYRDQSEIAIKNIKRRLQQFKEDRV